MKKIIAWLLTVLVCIGIFWLAAQTCQLVSYQQDKIEYLQAEAQELPDVYQIQEFLALHGYYSGKIDGYYGSKTRTAHDRYTNDRFAIAAFRKAMNKPASE